MNKDIEWLKEGIKEHEKKVAMFPGKDYRVISIPQLYNLIDQLNLTPSNSTGSEKVVVTSWFDKWCKGRVWGDKIREGGHYTRKDLSDLIEIADGGNLHGLTEKQGKDIEEDFFKYLNAIQIGYVVEEKKYYVLDTQGRTILGKNMAGAVIEGDRFAVDELWGSEIKEHQLTEKEIKDFDERYWSFKEPAEEME